MIESPDPITVTVPTALRVIGIGNSKFYELVKTGRIRTIKCGRRTLVPMQSLRDFLASIGA